MQVYITEKRQTNWEKPYSIVKTFSIQRNIRVILTARKTVAEFVERFMVSTRLTNKILFKKIRAKRLSVMHQSLPAVPIPPSPG